MVKLGLNLQIVRGDGGGGALEIRLARERVTATVLQRHNGGFVILFLVINQRPKSNSSRGFACRNGDLAVNAAESVIAAERGVAAH